MNLSLADDHAELDLLLNEFFKALESSEIERSFEKLDYFWARLAMHVRAEHIRLFPALLGALDGGNEGGNLPASENVRQIIIELRQDHDFFMRELAETVNALRPAQAVFVQITPDIKSLKTRILNLKTRLDAHNQVEEEKVYRLIDALLTPREREILIKSVQKELGNLPARFR